MENSAEENQLPKSPKIEIFQTIQKNLSSVGIDQNAAIQSRPLNARSSTVLLVLGYGCISELLYIINEAQSYFEFIQSIQSCSACALIFFVMLVMMSHLGDMFKMINDGEYIVNFCKWKLSILPTRSAELNSFFKQSFSFANIVAFKYSGSQSFLKETHQRLEKLSGTLFFLIANVTPITVVLLPFIYSFSIYFTTDSGPDAFILPLPMWWACRKYVL